METVCPKCGSTKLGATHHKEDHDLRICSSCGHVVRIEIPEHRRQGWRRPMFGRGF